jgi:LysR family transcriptional regulator, cyn operon transcriptional activator
MDFRQLEMFLAVAENSSFTLAGRHLHVAQSAISRKVGMLEEELGESLFKRVNKRIYLTPAGEVMLRYSRRVFQDLRTAALEVSEIGQMKRGSVRIGAGMTACMYVLPPVLEKFRSLYPNIETQVVTGTAENLLYQLRNNLLDLGILTLPVAQPDLQTIAFRTEEMVVLVSARHPTLAKRKSMPVKELAQHPLILFNRETATRKLLDKFFEQSGIRPLVAMESESVATIAPLVRINLGISIVPLPVAIEPSTRKELHHIRLSDVTFTRQIGLVCQRSDYQPRAIRELIDLFRASEQSAIAGA